MASSSGPSYPPGCPSSISFPDLLVPCSFSGASLHTAHFHLPSPCSGLRPGPDLPSRLVLPALPPGVLPSAPLPLPAAPCPPSPSGSFPGLAAPAPLLSCFAQVKLKSCSALCSFHLEHVQEGCDFQTISYRFLKVR